MNTILIIHESHMAATRIADALKQMYPSKADLFIPAGIGSALVGIGIEYAVWFSPLPDTHTHRANDWKSCSVLTRFRPGVDGNITPRRLAELMQEDTK
jgi:hypothetical protein